VWLAVVLVVGSLLAVVVGDTLVAQGQVRLADIQQAITSAQTAQKSMQTEVAELAAPDRVVAQGIALGLTAPAQVVNLPEVPLNVPLPAPASAGRSTASPAPAAAAATSTAK
jgi:type II secretory pathway pseudopilin PulG